MTRLLHAWSAGDVYARDQLITVVYKELRRRAAIHLRRERSGQTLQPTALVHEAYLRLVKQHTVWQNRAQFFGIASKMMRRILVDRARARFKGSRFGQWRRVTLHEALSVGEPVDVDVIALDQALTELATFDPRKSHIAELRIFSGLTLEETAKVLGISVATLERDWRAARAWLFKTLSAERPS